VEIRIECPNCKNAFELDKGLQSQFETHVEEEVNSRTAELKLRAAQLKESELSIEQQQREIDNLITSRVTAQLSTIRENAKEEFNELHQQTVIDFKTTIAEQQKKLSESQRLEIDLRKRVREVEVKESEIELELARRVDHERSKLKDVLAEQIGMEYQKIALEREGQMADLRKQIIELKRKAEEGSQQRQGEILEITIEEMLRSLFPVDEVIPVEKGVRGADILQSVINLTGHRCGKIAWEVKNTKSWSASWIDKVKENRNASKADIAVIVTEAMPKGTSAVALVDEVWIATPNAARGLAMALRHGMIELARSKNTLSARTEKADVLFRYLTSVAFRQRLEAVVDGFTNMRDDLEKEKRHTTKAWKTREKQLDSVLENTLEIYTDIQAVVGRNSFAFSAFEQLQIEGNHGVVDE